MDLLLGTAAAPQCQPTQPPPNAAQTQFDLLLQAAYSAIISTPLPHSAPSPTNLNLLNNLAFALGVHLPSHQQWPPSPFPPQFAANSSFNLAHPLLQIDHRPPLLLAPPPICPLAISLLPTCSQPDFNAHFLAASLQSNFLASADLPLPSPSDTCSGTSATGEERRNNSEEFAAEERAGAKNSNDDPCRAHRLSYPREFKLIVLHSFWANGQNKYRTCKEFQITKSMLNGWLQKADKIRNSRPGSLKSGRSGRRPQFPKIERQLFGLLREQIANGGGEPPITNKWIRENARRLAEMELGGSEKSTEGPIQCQFSERWLNNFKRRFGIQTGPKEGELVLEGDPEEEEGRKMEGVGQKNLGAEEEQQGGEDFSEMELERIGRQICASSLAGGLLPIQAFYAQFPKMSNEQNNANLSGKMQKLQN